MSLKSIRDGLIVGFALDGLFSLLLFLWIIPSIPENIQESTHDPAQLVYFLLFIYLVVPAIMLAIDARIFRMDDHTVRRWGMVIIIYLITIVAFHFTGEHFVNYIIPDWKELVAQFNGNTASAFMSIDEESQSKYWFSNVIIFIFFPTLAWFIAEKSIKNIS